MNPIDLQALYNTELETNLSTVSPILPEGDYIFTISKLPDSLEVITDKMGRSRLVFRPVATCVNPPDNKRYMPISLFINIDTTPDGKLDTSEGMNIELGRLREAVGQNTKAPWVFRMLLGTNFKGTIVHGINKNTNELVANIRQIRPITAE